MRVDFHTYYYAAEYIELMVRLGREDYGRLQSQDPDLGDRIAAQDEAGVHRQVLSFIGLNTTLEDAGAATEAAQTLNDVYGGVCDRYPGRFLFFAMLPLPHVDRAIAEAKRALASPTCAGVGLPCSIGGRPLDTPAFDDLWAELDARSALVFVHPVSSDSSGHWGMGDWGLMFDAPANWPATPGHLGIYVDGIDHALSTGLAEGAVVVTPPTTMPFVMLRLGSATPRA